MNIKRLLFRLVNPLRKLYWFFIRPRTYGVKCLLEHDGYFLMIRNTYGHRRWTLPGGRMKRNEIPGDAARREVLEEVGIPLTELMYIGNYFNIREYKRDTVYCFYARVPTNAYAIDPFEIQEAQWFPKGRLPAFSALSLPNILEMYSEKIGAPRQQ